MTSAREGTGRQVFDYHFLLHEGDWITGDVVRRAAETRSPFHVMQLEEQRLPGERNLPEQKSFLNLSGKGGSYPRCMVKRAL